MKTTKQGFGIIHQLTKIEADIRHRLAAIESNLHHIQTGAGEMTTEDIVRLATEALEQVRSLAGE